MIRPDFSLDTAHYPPRARGFTLIEMLVATTLTLIMMYAVVTIFAMVGESVSDSRSTLEMSERLRAAQATLQGDLGGLTVTMDPPRNPDANEGYFEYIEGPLGVVAGAQPNPVNNDNGGATDTTVGDFDDILMFTTRSRGKPFVGKWWNPNTNMQDSVESNVAEIAWFVRGNTLYRRVLLVAPGYSVSGNGNGFFANNDISVRIESGSVVANTLGDLTKRENRFAHQTSAGFPWNAGLWGQLRLPTLRECSSSTWTAGNEPPTTVGLQPTIDLWNNPLPWGELASGTDALSGYVDGSRIAEDVILTNVIGFDVKAWDPAAPLFNNGTTVLMPGDPGYPPNAVHATWPIVGYGAYVDLCYAKETIAIPTTNFSGCGKAKSQLRNTTTGPWTYDTWSTHYEHDAVDRNGDGTISGPGEGDQDNDGVGDEGTDGFDNDTAGIGFGIVDDVDERETFPPYPVPLRGIQVKIRVFEPDSRQIREVTVRQDFLPR